MAEKDTTMIRDEYENYTLYNADCMDVLREIPDKSVHLAIIDPPYNIGVATQKNGRKTVNAWDRIDNYEQWCVLWMREVSRILADNGVAYIWHNDIRKICKMLDNAEKYCGFRLVSFCIWDKGAGCRALSWKNRRPDGKNTPRSWFNRCEYCLHFFKVSGAGRAWRKTGWDRIDSDPSCFRSLKDWYRSEMERLALTKEDIARAYTEATGKKACMLIHYFTDSQFALPTKAVWESVFRPLGFSREYEDLRKEYEDLREEYEDLRKEYKELRHPHNCDFMHSNVWAVPPVSSIGRIHTCQKPLDLMQRIIRVSSRPGNIVFDPFMGSGSVGVAALREGRKFIGIERDAGYYAKAKGRIAGDMPQISLGG